MPTVRPSGTGPGPQVLKVVKDPVLQARVLADLKLGRSPRAIAGRLAAELDLAWCPRWGRRAVTLVG